LCIYSHSPTYTNATTCKALFALYSVYLTLRGSHHSMWLVAFKKHRREWEESVVDNPTYCHKQSAFRTRVRNSCIHSTNQKREQYSIRLLRLHLDCAYICVCVCVCVCVFRECLVCGGENLQNGLDTVRNKRAKLESLTTSLLLLQTVGTLK
jgi:hypothetical protein